jgi:hypothetical protein
MVISNLSAAQTLGKQQKDVNWTHLDQAQRRCSTELSTNVGDRPIPYRHWLRTPIDGADPSVSDTRAGCDPLAGTLTLGRRVSFRLTRLFAFSRLSAHLKLHLMALHIFGVTFAGLGVQ